MKNHKHNRPKQTDWEDEEVDYSTKGRIKQILQEEINKGIEEYNSRYEDSEEDEKL